MLRHRRLISEQELLDEAPKPEDTAGGKTHPAPDRAFMDDFLLTVLEQKDRLADELHSLNNEFVSLRAFRGIGPMTTSQTRAAA